MAQKGNNDGIIQYISSMQGTLQAIRNSVYATGNAMIDILTNYYLSYLPSTEFVRIKGILPETLPFDPYFFNTGYANLLQNAVEAILDMPTVSTPKLNITFSIGENYFRYTLVILYNF